MERNKILVQDFYSYEHTVDPFGHTTDDIQNLFSSPREFKLILFSGGADVNPALYGHESPDRLCGYSTSRDAIDTKIFKLAMKNNIKMVGICRGLQFLNVMSGGTMMHHISHHENSIHAFVSPRLSHTIYVNSLHHQMVMPHKDAFIIGSTEDQISTVYFGNNDQPEKRSGSDVEALYMPVINACGVQYHPEMMDTGSEGVNFFRNLVDEFLYDNEKEFTKSYCIGNQKALVAI